MTNIKECTYLATTPSSTHSKNYSLPNHIKHLLSLKRKARSRWQRHKYPIDKFTYNQPNNKLRKALLQHISVTYNHCIQNLTTHNSSLWKAMKKILETGSTPLLLVIKITHRLFWIQKKPTYSANIYLKSLHCMTYL